MTINLFQPGKRVSLRFLNKGGNPSFLLNFSFLIQGVLRAPEGITIFVPGGATLVMAHHEGFFFYKGAVPDIPGARELFLYENVFGEIFFPVIVHIRNKDAVLSVRPSREFLQNKKPKLSQEVKHLRLVASR